jgi:hypothetical protein
LFSSFLIVELRHRVCLARCSAWAGGSLVRRDRIEFWYERGTARATGLPDDL